MEAFHTEIKEVRGLSFRVEHHHDNDMGAPWIEHDGHGSVREVARNWYTGQIPKSPGEVVLHDGGSRGTTWVYDFAGAVARAKAEGWNTPPYNWRTDGERAAQAVQADMKHLRDWCADRWHWMGVSVTLLVQDADGELVDYTGPLLKGLVASLWGIESNSGDYLEEVFMELSEPIAVAYYAEQAEAAVWAARGMVTA